jgi:hypothetical protein
MKRTGFKIKPRKPLKRSKLNKEGKQKISVIQKKLWAECKRIIRARYGNTCYTCGKTNLQGSDWHTSHFIPKASCGAFLKYDLRILRPSCYHCNINLGGNGSEYYRRLVKDIGQESIDKIFQDKQKIVKAIDHYLILLEEYKKINE